MNQGAATVIEDEVVIFQRKIEAEELNKTVDSPLIEQEKVIGKTYVKERFTRLKKALRKKSSNIL